MLTTAFKFQFDRAGKAAETVIQEDSNKEGSSATEYTNIFFYSSIFITVVLRTG